MTTDSKTEYRFFFKNRIKMPIRIEKNCTKIVITVPRRNDFEQRLEKRKRKKEIISEMNKERYIT